MSTLSLLQFVSSIALIYFSAELIIRYGKVIALSMGVSRYIVGLTLIAFGTSFPEFVVSINASIMQESGIVFGNIMGSNIANIGLVLGLCAAIYSVATGNIKKEDLAFFLLSAILGFIFSWNGVISRFEGIILLLVFLLYCFFIKRNIADSQSGEKKSLRKSIDIYILIIIACSFFILIVGSDLFIESAIEIATSLGVSKVAISMTMVAIGTSLPELATSVIAILKKEYGLLTGNIIGSNIMNILMVLGPSSIISNIEVDISYLPLILMLSLTFLVASFSLFNVRFSRVMGFVLLIIYSTFVYSNF